MGFSGGGPSKAQLEKEKQVARDRQHRLELEARKRDREMQRLMEAQLRQAAIIPEIPLPQELPELPEAKPLPPPVMETSASIGEAQDDARRKASKRFGLKKTRYAGDTGGYRLGGTGQSLLGGESTGGKKSSTLLS